MTSAFRLGRIANIDIFADWTVLIIVMLVTMSLGAGLLPMAHPDWSAGLILATALLAALLLLVSILFHELAHALVGRRGGMDVERITLFVFGGVAHLRAEPRRWTIELGMALAGPLASLVIGGISLAIASALAPEMAASPPNDAVTLVGMLGPTAAVALWLGQVNIFLALFNLVPGFPLDGGRVLRALLWGATGDLRRATQYATAAGRLFAACLIVAGFAMVLGVRLPVFGAGLVNGLWLVLLGWLLRNAAVMSYRQVLVRDSLEHVPVSRVMRRDVPTVQSDLTVQDLVDQRLLGSGERAFAVLQGGKFAGLVTLEDIRKVDRDAWPRTPVREVMTPATTIHSLSPNGSAADAMLELGRDGATQLPVMVGGRLEGLVSFEDLLRVLKLYGDPSLCS